MIKKYNSDGQHAFENESADFVILETSNDVKAFIESLKCQNYVTNGLETPGVYCWSDGGWVYVSCNSAWRNIIQREAEHVEPDEEKKPEETVERLLCHNDNSHMERLLMTKTQAKFFDKLYNRGFFADFITVINGITDIDFRG